MRTIIIVGLVAILCSCKPEPTSSLLVEVSNTSSSNIFAQRNILSHADTLFVLIPNHGIFSTSYSDIGGDFSSIFDGIMLSDSLIVLFNDSLKIVHIPLVEGTFGSSQFEGRPEIIWRNHPRSLMNLESYTLEERGNDRNENVIARYTFTEEDLEYAISVYE